MHRKREVAGWFSKKEEKTVAPAATNAVFAERDPLLVRAAYGVGCNWFDAILRSLLPARNS